MTKRATARRAAIVLSAILAIGPAVSAQPAPPAPAPAAPAPAPVPPPPTFNDPNLPADAKDIEIDPQVEGAFPGVTIDRRSASHYTISTSRQIHDGGTYLTLHLTGIAGRTVELDFEGKPFGNWGECVPLFSYAADLESLESFDGDSKLPESLTKERPAVVDLAPALPETSKQAWHYFEWSSHKGERVCVRQAFAADQDSAYVAFKVPYTPTYNNAYLDLFHDDANVNVIRVGQSAGGQPLEVAVIAKEPPADGTKRPGVLIYARENPDDVDGSWIAQGVLTTLASDTPEMAALREQCDFIVIPMLDPDNAAAGSHGMVAAYQGNGVSQDAQAYMSWFKKWIEAGHRVDVAMSLHAPPVGSNFHLACMQMPPQPEMLASAKSLHKAIRDDLMKQGFAVRDTPWRATENGPILSGWLEHTYGTCVLWYAGNSVQAKQQLNLTQLRQIGTTIAKQTAGFLASDDGKALLKQVDAAKAAAATRPAQ